jgi:predicted nucleic acid-binding protein
MNTPLFLDTGYAVALAVKRDQYRIQALALNERIEREQMSVVTTRAVVFEIGNFLSASALRTTGARYLEALEEDPRVEIVSLTAELFRNAFTLYRERPDKTWSLTDCLSFTVMRRRGLTNALTGDVHFEQAGFNALLRE